MTTISVNTQSKTTNDNNYLNGGDQQEVNGVESTSGWPPSKEFKNEQIITNPIFKKKSIIGENIDLFKIHDKGKYTKYKTTNKNSKACNDYEKNHLDAWLENCYNDFPKTQQLSTTYPEYFTQNMTYAKSQDMMTTMIKPLTMNLSQINHQKLAMQGQQQQRQFISENSNLVVNNEVGKSIKTYGQHFGKNMFNMMTDMNVLNGYNTSMVPKSMIGGCSYFPNHDLPSQDFLSLPTTINNKMNTNCGNFLSELGNTDSTDIIDESLNNHNISKGFSDPCLLNPLDNNAKLSDRNTPAQINNNLQNTSESTNKYFTILLEHIQVLHETNSKICRNLNETKADIEILKNTSTWDKRHRSESISGLSSHSQPMIFNDRFSIHSPAPTYHSGIYTPGMMTDIVRDVKEAARVREDALLNRVKSLVDENQWSVNDCNLRLIRNMEDMKAQIHNLCMDRMEMNKRIVHLESENKYIRQLLSSVVYRHNLDNTKHENESHISRKLSYANKPETLNDQVNDSISLSSDVKKEENLHIDKAATTTEILAFPTQKDYETRYISSNSDSSITNDNCSQMKSNSIVKTMKSSLIPEISSTKTQTSATVIAKKTLVDVQSKQENDERLIAWI